MAIPLNDQIYTKSFTPREHQVELFYKAKEENIIVCLGKIAEQTFFVTKLIQELSFSTRRLLSEGGKRTLYILGKQEKCLKKVRYLRELTDLKTFICDSEVIPNFEKEFSNVQVIVATRESCVQLINENKILPSQINLVIVDQCHQYSIDNTINDILQYFSSSENVPKIVGLAVPLYNLTHLPGRIGLEVERIEALSKWKVETGSDIISILRYSPKPKEIIIESYEGEKSDLYKAIESCAMDAMAFLNDHRHNPMEIYDQFYGEEIKKISDAVLKPREMMEDFLFILKTLGPWCADRAAFVLIMMTEKFRLQTAYERNYLLFTMVESVFLKIRALCGDAFEYLTDKQRIFDFSSPKAHRLLKVLKTYKPDEDKNVNEGVKKDSTKEPLETQANVKSEMPNYKKLRPRHPRGIIDPDLLCGIIFVNKAFTAKILFYFLNEARKHDEDLKFLSPLYISEKSNGDKDSHDVTAKHKKQEDILKRFRIHECNLLIATSILEEGIDIPKCNLVIRYDFPVNYKSYVQCKTRARAADALHIIFVPHDPGTDYVFRLGQHHTVEKTLLEKSSSSEPLDEEEVEADKYVDIIPYYKPLEGNDAAKVTFNTAISLVNRYCAKLPSDTFTRLTPECSTEVVKVDDQNMYVCSLRLPINSPIKYVVSSYPMPNRAMARRMAALQLCVELHRGNEIDDNLLPIGKENFKAKPEDTEEPALPDDAKADFSEARPGTTKRRQYYYKKAAEALTSCRPKVGEPSNLYHISMVLKTPLPEAQNTRGRQIYPPEKSEIGFGILTRKEIPALCTFPIYTRSGEVHVTLTLSKQKLKLDETQIHKVDTFLEFTFTKVLRLNKSSSFDPKASEHSYSIVPVKKDGVDIQVDWKFVDCIYQNKDMIPRHITEEDRKNFEFVDSKYQDAVIMPWYRNKDQPQYFYVAEICRNLNPMSKFPGKVEVKPEICSDQKPISFKEYYEEKYKIDDKNKLDIHNLNQPLLDVDHTSARLNFLTPRYVNRKGVALPTSSEETKRAKRENLGQKQILVPELCDIHPFPASLWRQAVCLPCILYRINSLLLADQIRCEVAQKINLGQEKLDSKSNWDPLNFGWSLEEVVMKSKEMNKVNEEKSKDPLKLENKSRKKIKELSVQEEKESSSSDEEELKIGTWSNETTVTSTDLNYEEASVLNTSGVETKYAPNTSSSYESSTVSSSSSDELPDYSSEEEEEEDGIQHSQMVDDTYDENEKLKQEVNKNIYNEFSDYRSLSQMSWNYDEEDDEGIQKHSKPHLETSEKEAMDIMKGDDIFVSGKQDIAISRKNTIELSDKQKNFDWKYKDYVEEIASRFKDHISNKTPSPKIVKKQSVMRVMRNENEGLFSFDSQPELEGHPGPNPSLILQALTMSNANDGINLERLETIGDSFLKYAITTYLYCSYDNIHEGKLSHLRSKQVSNLNLYRLGKNKKLGESMIATKFEPHDNWLPPCYYVSKEFKEEIRELKDEIKEAVLKAEHEIDNIENKPSIELDNLSCSTPYNLITQHSIPDKSIADCVEALIGAYLIACGPRGALLFMTWLGIHVLPTQEYCVVQETKPNNRPPGSTEYKKGKNEKGQTTWTQIRYAELEEPQNPLLKYVSNPEEELELMLDGYDVLETEIAYKFQDRSYLLQAFTHASYQPNRLTDCYQRLEFLGDAVLDYLITRHLYEDSRQHSPGSLTDLRSALVNNTIFASLAVRCGFHKYFRHLSPGLSVVIDRFVRIQEENGHSISEEYYLMADEESEEAEDIEVPKALGDVFESLAGAIYLDSGMSLDAVWGVYYRIMKSEIEKFSTNVPKSPIRELLELEPETAKFGKPEKLADGRRVRVTVNVFGKGFFSGIGRNYRIAKCTAAKCALKHLKKMQSYQKKKL